MITVRKAADRGSFDFGWLDTRHSFSFGDYHDPDQMGFRALRVINEDRVKPGQGFGKHGHRDMEILTWVMEGALEHEDNTGTHGVIRHGDVQRMSAGTGIMHSEFNGSKQEPVHFYQIWIVPDRRGAPPRYDDKGFPAEGRSNRLQLLASPDGAGGSLTLHRNVRVYAADLEAGKEISLDVGDGRGVWVQVTKGSVGVGHGFGVGKGGLECAGEWAGLGAGDGAAMDGERKLAIRAEAPSQILVFDLD